MAATWLCQSDQVLDMKIATWNLESVRASTNDREDAFHEAMKQVDADVWVLTETWANFPPGNDYRLIAESHAGEDLTEWPNRRWVAIWSRLEGKKIEVQCQTDRLACVLIQPPTGKAILVMGTVLPWLSDAPWPGADGFCSALGGQVAEWTRLETMHPNAGLFVAGDFNQSFPYQQHYGSMRGAEALDDALKTLDLQCLTEGDHSSNGKPWIDHLCVKHNMVQTGSKPEAETWPVPCVQGREITDHPGVSIKIMVSPFQ